MKYSRVFLVTAIFAGTAYGMLDLVVSFLSGSITYLVIITFLLSGVIFGLGVTIFISAYTKYFSYSRRSFLFLLLCLIGLGIFLGTVPLTYLNRSPLIGWMQLPRPPEKPVALHGYQEVMSNSPVFYIETKKNAIYGYMGSSAGGEQWKKGTLPQNEFYYKNSCSTTRSELIHPIYPGVVTAKEVIDGCQFSVRTHLIILTNGSVWIWTTIFDYLPTAVITSILILIGPILVLVATVITVKNNNLLWRIE